MWFKKNERENREGRSFSERPDGEETWKNTTSREQQAPT
jgi:hypothetical protein